jgi:hypothetical protein
MASEHTTPIEGRYSLISRNGNTFNSWPPTL